jgi:hypothetical protein
MNITNLLWLFGLFIVPPLLYLYTAIHDIIKISKQIEINLSKRYLLISGYLILFLLSTFIFWQFYCTKAMYAPFHFYYLLIFIVLSVLPSLLFLRRFESFVPSIIAIPMVRFLIYIYIFYIVTNFDL